MFDLTDLFTSTTELNPASAPPDPLRLSKRASEERLILLKS